MEHIYNLDYPRDKIVVSFLENHPDQTAPHRAPFMALEMGFQEKIDPTVTLDVLDRFRDKTGHEYKDIRVDSVETDYHDLYINGARSAGRDFQHFASIRNRWVEGNTCDYIFSIDTDILTPPNSLKQLLSHNKDIISLLIMNGPIQDPYIPHNPLTNFLLPYLAWPAMWNPEYHQRLALNGRMAFNIMNKSPIPIPGEAKNEYDRVNYVHIHPSELLARQIIEYDSDIMRSSMTYNLDYGPFQHPTRYGPLPEVDMTGAAYLINSDVVDDGVRYGFHHQGEDPYFCADAQKKGYRIYCDYTLHGVHLMNKAMHQQYIHEQQQHQQVRVLRHQPKGLKV